MSDGASPDLNFIARPEASSAANASSAMQAAVPAPCAAARRSATPAVSTGAAGREPVLSLHVSYVVYGEVGGTPELQAWIVHHGPDTEARVALAELLESTRSNIRVGKV